MTARQPEAPDEVRLALDVAREAIRKGVPEVHMYCLESLEEIPGAHEEIEEAEKEGIQLHTRFGPRRILGSDGKVTGIELSRPAASLTKTADSTLNSSKAARRRWIATRWSWPSANRRTFPGFVPKTI